MGLKNTIALLALASPALVAAKPDKECKPAYDAVYEAFGDFEFGGDKEAGEKLPGLIKECTKQCPGPYSDECLAFKDVETTVLEDVPEECAKAQDAMFTAFGDFEFGGDEKAGEKLPSLVGECRRACRGSKRLEEDCLVFGGPQEYDGIAPEGDYFFAEAPGPVRFFFEGAGAPEGFGFGPEGAVGMLDPIAELPKKCEEAVHELLDVNGAHLFSEDRKEREASGKKLPELEEKCKKVCEDYEEHCITFIEGETKLSRTRE